MVCSKWSKDYLCQIRAENVCSGVRYGCECNVLRNGGITLRSALLCLLVSTLFIEGVETVHFQGALIGMYLYTVVDNRKAASFAWPFEGLTASKMDWR